MPPPPTAAPTVLRTYLQLLAEAYRRTVQLADRLHDAGGADVKTKVSAATRTMPQRRCILAFRRGCPPPCCRAGRCSPPPPLPPRLPSSATR